MSARHSSPVRATSGARRWSRPLLAAVMAVFFVSAAHAQGGLGDPAPDFTLIDNDGRTVTLSDAFGDKVQLLHMVGYG